MNCEKIMISLKASTVPAVQVYGVGRGSLCGHDDSNDENVYVYIGLKIYYLYFISICICTSASSLSSLPFFDEDQITSQLNIKIIHHKVTKIYKRYRGIEVMGSIIELGKTITFFHVP